ncbi:Hypothetical predicted protein [Paramuricea clavata]|uniref:Uncharacterized protein n=1 Tax=Paramuricea clavata TaxID=317549 RepID=A0A6S7H8I2_PARCT|nr:Hypothetical predicted protein [Paramuricea clavata]
MAEAQSIERKRAIRKANRGVITKYINEANDLLHDEDSDRDRLITIQGLLREKLDYIKRLDSEILEICEIKDIVKEIIESEEINTRVLDVNKKILKATSEGHLVTNQPAIFVEGEHINEPQQSELQNESVVSNNSAPQASTDQIQHNQRNELASQSSYVQSKDGELIETLGTFWDTESIGITNYDIGNPEQSKFLREVSFDKQEGRYQVRLPWKTEALPQSNGYSTCVRRLRQLHSHLKKDKHLLNDYDSVIKQQLESGIIEAVPEEDDDSDGSYYLPHHGVLREDKETTKLRVVFDGSAEPNEESPSINECLEKGRNLVPNLFDTVIKFRSHPIGIVADIEKAFHQIQISPEDRRMLRFLWFDDITEPVPKIRRFQFCRLVFGLTPSPAVLASIIQHHLSRHKEREPEMVSLLNDSFYVDNFAGGAKTDDDAVEVYEKAQAIMKDGGFTLRKWMSNSKKFREMVEKNEEHQSYVNADKPTLNQAENDTWLHGPKFLKDPKDQWPKCPQPTNLETDVALKLKRQETSDNSIQTLSANDIKEAEILWAREVQAVSFPEFEISSTNQSLTRRAKHQNRVLKNFTTQWKEDYLLSLRESSKAQSRGAEIISVGDIVVLKNESTARIFWKLAKVEELITSKDNIVRSAKVGVLNEANKKIQLRRPIQHLVPLEISRKNMT